MSKIETGKKAPLFTLKGTGGDWSLKDAVGQPVVMYFYPRDNTPGCTEEGESFSSHFADFKKAKTLIFGISADSVESHEKFKKKMGFPFDLLSDPDNTVCKLYDVIQEKSMYGRKYMGIVRSAFVVDPEGKIAGAFYKVSPKATVGHVTKALQEMGK